MVIFLLFGVLIATVLIFIWIKWKYSYWKRKNVVQIDPSFPFGNIGDVFFGRKKLSMDEKIWQMYTYFKQKGCKFGGYYALTSPVWLPVDVKLVKHVFQNDFQHFTDHLPFIYHHEKEILTEHVFSLQGEKWRRVRATLTPTFTTGRIKMMFDIVNQLGNVFHERVKHSVGKSVDIKEAAACFTTDVIASCAFGLETNCMNDSNVEFRKMGRKVFQGRIFRFLIELFVPWTVLGNLGYKSMPKDTTNFFMNLMTEALRHRRENNVHRQDFVQLMSTLIDKQKEATDKNVENGISTEDALATMFFFYLAGFETSSSVTSFCLYELAKSQTIQDQVRDEIQSVLAKNMGKLTYEALQEMHFLQNCINESLRLYPPVAFIGRTCTRTYKIPESDVIIEKGTQVVVSAIGIHRDPEYYENPDEFNPNNFNQENTRKRKLDTFMPFGEGPRHCIGLRFGIMQIKVALVYLLKDFKYSLNEKTPVNLTFKAGLITLGPNEDLILDVFEVL